MTQPNIYAALPANGYVLKAEYETVTAEVRALSGRLLTKALTFSFIGCRDILGYRSQLAARRRAIRNAQSALCRKCLGTGIHTIPDDFPVPYCSTCGHTAASARQA